MAATTVGYVRLGPGLARRTGFDGIAKYNGSLPTEGLLRACNDGVSTVLHILLLLVLVGWLVGCVFALCTWLVLVSGFVAGHEASPAAVGTASCGLAILACSALYLHTSMQ